MLLLHVDLPDRHQPLPRSSAKTECAQGRVSGGDGFFGRRVQRAGAIRGCALGSESGTRSHAAGTGQEDWSSVVAADTARTHGIRTEALPRAEAPHRRRDAEYNRRDGQEHAVPGDAETARGSGGDEMRVRDELRVASCEQVGRHKIDGCRTWGESWIVGLGTRLETRSFCY